MSKWTKTTLGKIADIITGPFGSQLHQSDYVKRGIPIVMPQDIGNRNINYSTINYVSEEDATRLKRYSTVTNDILYARRGDVEKHAFVRAKDAGVLCGTGCLRVRINSNEVESAFLSFYLNREETRKWLVTHAVGTNMPNLNTDILSDVPIAYPTLKEQRKIVKVLNCLEERIVLNEKINDNLEQQAATYFQELFINNANPMWQISTISDLGTVVGGSTPSKTKPEYYTNNGIAWITPKDLSINKSKFISHGENDITELGLKNSSATVMPKGTVLFSSRAPIGYIAIASNEVTTNQGFKSVIPYSEIGTAFVYFFLKHSLPVIESAASGSTFKEISGSAMKNIPAIIPDRNTLDQFNSFCAPIFAQQKILEEQNHSLAMLRDSLLPKLMSGAIDIASIQI